MQSLESTEIGTGGAPVRVRIVPADLATRRRRPWAYPAALLGFPVAVAFGLTMRLVVLGAVALVESADQYGEASPDPSEEGGRWCGRCHERREDRRVLD